MHAFMKYYNEKWDDIMNMDAQQFLFRVNEMNLVFERERKELMKRK